MKAIFSCRDASRLMSTSLDRKLTMMESVELAMHLMMCRGCTNYRRDLRTLHQLIKEGKLHELPHDARLSEEARNEILDAIRDADPQDEEQS